jgi:sporulation protein YlmC with PRC-barrel domain
MFGQAAEWIAPAATMIAAMMTAANLGSRVTGWGFVVFTVGAIAWVIVALASGQQNLLISNGFLLIVDLVGVWRWLGRRARYDSGAEAAAATSKEKGSATLFALSKIEGRTVLDANGEKLGEVIDAMAGCSDGAIRYFVVSRGGIGGVGEQLHAIGWREARIEEASIVATVNGTALAARPVLDPAHWPASAEAAGVRG